MRNIAPYCYQTYLLWLQSVVGTHDLPEMLYGTAKRRGEASIHHLVLLSMILFKENCSYLWSVRPSVGSLSPCCVDDLGVAEAQGASVGCY